MVLQPIYQQKCRRGFWALFIRRGCFYLSRQPAQGFREIAVFDLCDWVGNGPDDAIQEIALRRSGLRTVEKEETRAAQRELCCQRDEGDGHHRQGCFFAL